jgi:uncharacterized repeat protein (TIGR03803 family)
MPQRNSSRFLLAILVMATASLVSADAAWAAPQLSVLYSFGTAPDGNYPAANLVFDTSGNLYGTTVQGGAFGSGAVFKLGSSNGVLTETVLYSFCQQASCIDGSTPYGSLVVDSAGNLYGTTYEGGVYGGGVVFKLTPNPTGGWAETVVHSFGNDTDGIGPLAGVIFGRAGNLYGTTSSGGTGPSCFTGCGTVFELARAKSGQWREKVLYNFCSLPQCTDGDSPLAGLILDTAGNIYGTTELGGTSVPNDGTAFELTQGKNGQWTETILHAFLGGTDGASPQSALVLDKVGNLYGTTVFGGNSTYGANNGTVFKLIRGANGKWTEKIVYSFCSQQNCVDGSSTYAGLTIDSAGSLYGTNSTGGASDWGTVFELSPGINGKWTDTVLHDFTGQTDGVNPHAGLVLDTTGNIYGVAYQGGIGGYGTAFKLTP